MLRFEHRARPGQPGRSSVRSRSGLPILPESGIDFPIPDKLLRRVGRRESGYAVLHMHVVHLRHDPEVFASNCSHVGRPARANGGCRASQRPTRREYDRADFSRLGSSRASKSGRETGLPKWTVRLSAGPYHHRYSGTGTGTLACPGSHCMGRQYTAGVGGLCRNHGGALNTEED